RAEQAVAKVEPKVGLSFIPVRTMTLIARFREDWPDVAIEVDRARIGDGAGGRRDRDHRHQPGRRSSESHEWLLRCPGITSGPRRSNRRAEAGLLGRQHGLWRRSVGPGAGAVSGPGTESVLPRSGYRGL